MSYDFSPEMLRVIDSHGGKSYVNTNWRLQIRDEHGRYVEEPGSLEFLGTHEGNTTEHVNSPELVAKNSALKEELQSTWGRDMDDEQLSIMRSYTEAEGEIKPVQGFLRTGSVSEKWRTKGFSEEWAAHKASELDSIMVEGSKPVVSWRGISDEAAEDLFGLERGSLLGSNELDIVGDEYRDGGFVSTSFRRGAYNTRVVLKITTPAGFKGLWAQPHSGYPNEDELILGRGSTFKVKSVDLGDELNVNKPGPYWEARRGQRSIVVDVEMVDQQ